VKGNGSSKGRVEKATGEEEGDPVRISNRKKTVHGKKKAGGEKSAFLFKAWLYEEKVDRGKQTRPFLPREKEGSIPKRKGETRGGSSGSDIPFEEREGEKVHLCATSAREEKSGCGICPSKRTS